jgi:hypothetical protein
MHRQMTLWPEPQKLGTETEIWQQFHPDTQRILITTLARLILKALYPKSLTDSEEVGHESK